ncbi:MAG: hypothetical protein LBT13_02400 [Treponema sp.]|nr:hypothetical protein [Treponema sp.]
MLFHSSNAGKNDWYNPENFRNTLVDGYLDQALNARSITASIPFWQKAQWDGTGTSLRGDAPYIFLINKDHLKRRLASSFQKPCAIFPQVCGGRLFFRASRW